MNSRKLKKKSETVFEELPKDGQSRPLEWRGQMCRLDLLVKNPQIRLAYSVNGYNFSDFSNLEGKLYFLTSDEKRQRRLRLQGEGLLIRDAVYLATHEGYSEPADGLFDITKAERVNLVLVGADGETSKERTPNTSHSGVVFQGYCLQAGALPELELNLDVPLEYLAEVAEQLKAKPEQQLRLFVSVLAYTNEMDDAFREPDASQDLVLRMDMPAFLEWMQLEPADTPVDGLDELQEVVAPLPPYAPYIDAIVIGLGKLKMPLWILAVGVILLLFK